MKSILFAAVATLSLAATPVLAGGWGGGSSTPTNYGNNAYNKTNYSYNGHNNQSGAGLINVSPTIGIGGVANGVLAGSTLASGNSILSGVGILGSGTSGLLNNIVGNIRKR